MYFNYLLEGSKTVEMCLKTMFLCTCHHLSHFSADFGGPYLNYVSIYLLNVFKDCFVAILKLHFRRFDVTGLHYQVKRNKICRLSKYKKNNYYSSLRKRKVTYKNMLQFKHVKEFCTDGVTARPQFFDESVAFHK